LRKYDIRDDFYRYMYRQSVEQQYYLNLRGGGERLAWTASAGMDNNVSNQDAASKRYNMRLHSTYKPLDRLTLTSSISYTYRTSANGKPGYGEVGRSGMYIYPYARFADELGNPLPVARDVRTSWADTVAHGGLLDWHYYPLIDHEQVSNRTYVDDILLNLGANYTILPGLDVDFKYLFERQHTKGRNHNGEQSYFARNMVNRFSQVEEGGAISRAVPVGAILDQINNLVESNNVRIQSNFNKAWRQHQITAIAGWELRRANRTGNR